MATLCMEMGLEVDPAYGHDVVVDASMVPSARTTRIVFSTAVLSAIAVP